MPFTVVPLHLWLWVTTGDVQEPPCLRHRLAPPDQHHLIVVCTQNSTHTQRLSQQRQGVSELCASQLTELRHSAWPVCSQVVLVARQAESQSEERPRLFIAQVFCSFSLIHGPVSSVQTVLSRISGTLLLHSCAAVQSPVLLLCRVWDRAVGGISAKWMLRRNQAEGVQSELGPVEKPRLLGHPFCPHLLYLSLQNWIRLPVKSGSRRKNINTSAS